jgi:hypothetical protein
MIFLRYVAIFHLSSSVLINVENMFKDLSRSFCTCFTNLQGDKEHMESSSQKLGMKFSQKPIPVKSTVSSMPTVSSLRTVSSRPIFNSKLDCQKCPHYTRVEPIDEDKEWGEEEFESMLM